MGLAMTSEELPNGKERSFPWQYLAKLKIAHLHCTALLANYIHDGVPTRQTTLLHEEEQMNFLHYFGQSSFSLSSFRGLLRENNVRRDRDVLKVLTMLYFSFQIFGLHSANQRQ